MPTYTYQSCCANTPDNFEINVPIADRDLQWCAYCGEQRKRKITFTGLTWAPTAGGMR